MMILKRSLSVHHSCTSIFIRMIDSCHSGLVYIYMLLIEALSFRAVLFFCSCVLSIGTYSSYFLCWHYLLWCSKDDWFYSEMSLHVNTGFSARYCDENGFWEDARVDDCESNEFRSIREMVGIKYKISSSITLESQLFSKKCVLLCICLCMVCIMWSHC